MELIKLVIVLFLIIACTSSFSQPKAPQEIQYDLRGPQPHVSVERGRPKIEGNTIVTEQGTRLRGGTFWIYGWIPSKTTWALSPEPWKLIKENNFNTIRLACAYRTDHEDNYTLEEYDTILDSLFYLADQYGVYLVIDFHDTPGTYNMESAREFWQRYSKRYKDRKNAIFELTNEPVFSRPAAYTAEMLRDFEELWRICDTTAPETPVILLSFCQVGPDKAFPAEIADSLRGINWNKSLVGFHSYWRDSSLRIVDLKQRYPCMNTEFMCQTVNTMKVMDGYAYHGTLMETLEISWLQWDILDRPESSVQNLPLVIADLKDHDVFWEKDSVQNIIQTGYLTPNTRNIFNGKINRLCTILKSSNSGWYPVFFENHPFYNLRIPPMETDCRYSYPSLSTETTWNEHYYWNAGL